jgi:hypothetical protein
LATALCRLLGGASPFASAATGGGDAHRFAGETGKGNIFSEEASQLALQIFDALLELERAT